MTLLLAAVLCTGPAFWVPDSDLPDCQPARQIERCTCSEYLLWADDPGSVAYEIERCLKATRARTFDEARLCELVGTTTANEWFFVNDDPVRLGRTRALWRYRVRGVSVSGVRGEWAGPVFYRRNPWPTR